MKHALALMTLFLVLLLVITTVMAVGNSKQAQQMAQRAQLISSLRTELRKSQQDMKALHDQLNAQHAAARALRTERDALNLRYARLIALLESPVEPDRLLPSLTAFRTPGNAQTLPGESWLQAEALRQALRRVEKAAVPSAETQPDAVPETLSASPAAASADSSPLTPALVPSASPAAPENAPPDPPALHEANGIAGSAKAQNEGIAATPAVTASSSVARSHPPATPSVSPTPAATPAPSITPTPFPIASPKAQAASADTTYCEPCFPFFQPPAQLTKPLLRGLKTAQRILRWLEEAVDALVRRLSPILFPLS